MNTEIHIEPDKKKIKKPINITANEVDMLLHRFYVSNCRYKVSNVYLFKSNWESDFFVLKPNGYAYEFEIKVSKADFKKDSDKTEKHLILKTGKTNKLSRDAQRNLITTTVDHKKIPNKFYYVIPENIIDIDEVPEYAGLIIVRSRETYLGWNDETYQREEKKLEKPEIYLHKVKEAPFLHKDILDLSSGLCDKFYYKYLSEKQENHILHENLKEQRELVKFYKEQLQSMQK